MKEISLNIINDFKKKNIKSPYKYKDFQIIAQWAYKNIKYDYNCIGKDMDAMEIYNKKIGVCKDFTKLCNALLYSIGYQVIYISGIALDQQINFYNGTGHAWSLVKDNGKWYPFDATWGIYFGKLPVSHIFVNCFNLNSNILGTDSCKFGKTIEEIEFVE